MWRNAIHCEAGGDVGLLPDCVHDVCLFTIESPCAIIQIIAIAGADAVEGYVPLLYANIGVSVTIFRRDGDTAIAPLW